MSAKSISWSTDQDTIVIDSYSGVAVVQSELFYTWNEVRLFHVAEILRTEKSFALRLLEKLPLDASIQEKLTMAQILQLLERKTGEWNRELVEYKDCEGLIFSSECGRKSHKYLVRHLSVLKLISDRTIAKAKAMTIGKMELNLVPNIYRLLRFLAHRVRILFKQLLYEASEVDRMDKNRTKAFSSTVSSSKRTISPSRRQLAVQRHRSKKHKNIDLTSLNLRVPLPTIKEEEELTTISAWV